MHQWLRLLIRRGYCVVWVDAPQGRGEGRSGVLRTTTRTPRSAAQAAQTPGESTGVTTNAVEGTSCPSSDGAADARTGRRGNGERHRQEEHSGAGHGQRGIQLRPWGTA